MRANLDGFVLAEDRRVLERFPERPAGVSVQHPPHSRLSFEPTRELG